MLLKHLEGRQVLFFGGKGGVGKTTIASSVAAGLADAGKNVLVVSTDPAHNLGHLWQREIGPRPVLLRAGLHGMELDPASTVDEHLSTVETSLRRIMPERLGSEIRRQMNAAREAPGMVEAAMLERMAVTIEQGLSNHDVVIFDTAPTGHTVRLLELPELMAAWTQGLLDSRSRADGFSRALSQFRATSPTADEQTGKIVSGEPDRDHEIRSILTRRQDRFRALRQVLTNSERTAFIIVLMPERLPVLESIDLYRRLSELDIAVGAMVLNKCAPSREGEFWQARALQEDQNITALSEVVGDLLRIQIPLAANEIIGGNALAEFAERHLATVPKQHDLTARG